MAYKVLSNILVKDTTSTSLVTLNSAMLVVMVNKDTKKNVAFKALDKASKGYISKSISTHLKDDGSSILLPQINGTKAENILLVKGLDKNTPIYKWLSAYQAIAKSANKLKAKDLSVMCGNIYPEGKDENWLIEMVAKTIESNVYIFSQTKNKTAKTPSLKNLVILTTGLSGVNLTNAKQAAKKGFAIGEGVNTAKHLGDLPANHCTPRIIEKKVKAMKKDFPKLKITSFN
ncbi:MAG: leucyl aminopeptidase, partial [Gammaproteobacteria bacterium]|nr:leucyl aminopeptidase [Gammaproteobacteria bacterium]